MSFNQIFSKIGDFISRLWNYPIDWNEITQWIGLSGLLVVGVLIVAFGWVFFIKPGYLRVRKKIWGMRRPLDGDDSDDDAPAT